MASLTFRCTRCGYTPMAPGTAPLHAGAPCLQCGQPMVAGDANVPAPSHGSARPMGIEDRRATPRRAAAPATEKKGSRAIVILATWAAIAAALLARAPDGTLAKLGRKVDSLVHGAKQAISRASGRTPSDSFMPPADFAPLVGTWVGRSLDGSGPWAFSFSEPATVQLQEEDGTVWSGEGRVYWERGDDDGLRVLEGGYPLDLALTRRGERRTQIVLGTYRIEGADRLQLCLGRPGALVRTSEFRSSREITCWALVRAGAEP